MTTPDDAVPQNVQNLAAGSSGTQINHPEAPVILNPKDSKINFNYYMEAQRERIQSSGAGAIPLSGAAHFVGREKELEELHEQLQAGATLAISAISGMGGIGKTELALQYALKQRSLDQYPGGICWVRARELVGTQIVAFARSQFQLVIPDDLDLDGQVAFCWAHWRDGATLIVLDDVQTYDAIAPFLPPQQSQFKVLMTTRSRFGSPVKNYEIKVLSEAASLELLRQLVADERVDQDLATAQQVCEWLGYLPLGLELVGRYLARKPDTSMATLWERLQANRLAAIALKEAAPEMTAKLGVAAAFELSWQELDQQAQRLAAFLSLFALAEIPWELVQMGLPEEDAEELEEVRDRKLVDLSLLARTGQGMYELHQLLREFFGVKRSQMAEDEEMKRSFCRVMSASAEKIAMTWTLLLIEQVSSVIPHFKEATTTLEPWLTDEDLIKPATRIGQFYEKQSAFAEAEEWFLHCRTILTQRLGENHPDVATSLNNLALLYYLQGRYEQAEPLYLQALELRRSLLGEIHPDVATSLNNLAALYESQGCYEQAEPLYLQALELRRFLLGETHPAVATSLNNLAGLYYLQGRYEQAEPLYLQALELHRSLLGKMHPHVATSLNNLAGLYESQGRYEDAEPLFLQALQISRKTLGDDHPDVAIGLNNLARLYESLERYAEAEPMYLQAMAIFYQRLGETHPNMQTVWENFIEFLQQVIQRDRTSELSDHPTTRSLLQQLQNAES